MGGGATSRWRVGWTVTLGLLLAPGLVTAKFAPDSFDLGFIASRHTDVLGHTRTKALGPIWEKVVAPGDVTYAGIRPLGSRIEDPVGDRNLLDLLWPLYNKRDLGHETSWQAGIFFGYGHGEEDPRRHREWFIPFYFQGRNAQGETYRALFPIGGTIDEILGRDTISFVLFPLYIQTRINEVYSKSVLWPIYSRTRGPGIDRMRVFPFYGESHVEGKFDKRFVLWPIWNDVQYHYPKSSGSGFVLFPLYGQLNLTDQKTTWVVPPLFRFTRGEDQNLVYCPWPFVQWGSGDKDFFYLFPLYGHKQVGNLDRHFLAWPFLWHSRVTYPDSEQTRWMAVPFFIHKHRYAEQAGGKQTLARYVQVWPLFSYHRQGETSRFRMIALLPFGEIQGVERNWAPLWSLVQRTAHQDNVDWEILWGLYRDFQRGDQARYRSLFPLMETWRDERVDPPYHAWSFLKGLLERERRGEDKRWRMLYFFTIGDEMERPSF